MLCQLRGVETFLNVDFVGGLALRVREWLSIEKDFIQVFHSILKDCSLSLLINLILPDSTVDHNLDFSFDTRLDSISPCQGSKPAISNTNNHNLFFIGKHVFLVEIIDCFNDIFRSFEIHDLILISCVESLKYDPPSQDFIITFGHELNMLFDERMPFKKVNEPPQLLLEPKSMKLF